MAINALVITGPDPGAVPGGSTITLTCVGRLAWGRNRIDGRVKGIAFARVRPVTGSLMKVANDNFAEEVALAA